MPALEREFPISSNNSDYVSAQIVYGALGCYYPSPPIAEPLFRRVAQKYLQSIIPDLPAKVDFDIFATEGACGSMAYLFETLLLNGVLNPGDVVAIYSPIFSPYIEFMRDPRFKFRSLYLRTTEEDNWQLTDTMLHDLEFGTKGCRAPPRVLFDVNPMNPMSARISYKDIRKIGEVVRRRNKSKNPLFIVSDIVYAPFVSEFPSLLSECPEATLAVVSLSKFFGATGTRLGFTALADKNVIDDKILPFLKAATRRKNEERYSTVLREGAQKIKFIERMLLTSRGVANAHTAGLSTPQQMLACLFMIRQILDGKKYAQSLWKCLAQRWIVFDLGLYTGKGSPSVKNVAPIELVDSVHRARSANNHTHYYYLVDLRALAYKLAGQDGVAKLERNHYLSMVFILASKFALVALDGAGFGAKKYTVRISLANNDTQTCNEIGIRVRNAMKVLLSSKVYARKSAGTGDYIYENCRT